MDTDTADLFIRAEGISKTFGSVRANRKINLEIRKGEIHSLVGENGAGKSTLMKILYGALAPDEGTLSVEGKQVYFASPLDAIDHGIGMVFQHFMLVDRMTVLENLILGNEPRTHGLFVDRREALSQLARHSSLVWNPDEEVRDLNVSRRQQLEILKLLVRHCHFLIFDEPTGVLAPQEIEVFLKSLEVLRAEGKTILLITHKIPEVLKVSDRVSVMRAGQMVGTYDARELSPPKLAELMVGREVRSWNERYRRETSAETATDSALSLLRVKNLKSNKLKNLSFELHPGEILGIAGVEGNGQSDLVKCLSGVNKPQQGEIYFRHYKDEKLLNSLSVHRRKKAGISWIPEDRHREGLVLDMNLIENYYLGVQAKVESHTLLPRKEMATRVERALVEFEIKAPDGFVKVGSLSGGNQQKLIVARELDYNPSLLIACQPTRGVDIGAIEKIHAKLLEKRAHGLGIILISSELDELLCLSDRILVLREGEISLSLSSEDLNQKNREALRCEIGEAMLCSTAS